MRHGATSLIHEGAEFTLSLKRKYRLSERELDSMRPAG